MSIKERIDQDLKQAMLAGDKTLVTTLRGLKGAILNVEVAEGKREPGLTDDEVIKVLSKEAKKRQESADLYVQGGNREKADAELTEKQVIGRYLPVQMPEAELSRLIDTAIAGMDNASPQAIGQIIGKVKSQAGPAADGALIANLVRKRLEHK